MHNFRLVYLNGEFVPPERALVSAFDRGFIFADGVYEVIPVFARRLFRLPHHLARLDRSLHEIRLRNPLAAEEWGKIFARLVQACDASDLSIYLQVTRGVAPRDHAFPAQVTPTVFAYAQPLKLPTSEVIERGVVAVTASDNRWLRCDIKAIALLPNALLRQQAIERGAVEAILVREGLVTEGAASNVFLVRDGVLYTPPTGPFILPGITRDLVLELARANGTDAREEPIAEGALFEADEIWLTSSMREISAVTRLNDRPVGSGKLGPLYTRMLALYRAYKQAFAEGRVE
ncbi:MAG: D-amino acid aminotransferase [Sulfurifustaceae bacterium]